MAISSGSCLTPQPLSPAPPDTEGSPGSPQLLPPTIPSAVEDYLAIRALPYVTSGQFVLSMMNRPVLWTDRHIHTTNPPPVIDAGNFSSAMDRWIEDVRFHGFRSVDMLTLSCAPVHLIPRKRILLRDRRGVPNRPFQSHWPQHRGSILPVRSRPRHRCL